MRVIFLLFSLHLITSCMFSKFPKEVYQQFICDVTYSTENDSVTFNIKNPVKSPVRIIISSEEIGLHRFLAQVDTLQLPEQSDTLLIFYCPDFNISKINFEVHLGDLNRPIIKNKITYPFPKNRRYRIIQGYNGKFSHNTNYNRYAIDFNLKTNDTICSADSGYVVGVIKDYKYGGRTKKWKDHDRSNIITIYHPHSGLYTQYGHLVHQGSLVKLGDKVRKGQAIGLSGKTGYTTIEHLHFNVLKPAANEGLESVKIEFDDGRKGEDLKERDIIINI